MIIELQQIADFSLVPIRIYECYSKDVICSSLRFPVSQFSRIWKNVNTKEKDKTLVKSKSTGKATSYLKKIRHDLSIHD